MIAYHDDKNKLKEPLTKCDPGRAPYREAVLLGRTVSYSAFLKVCRVTFPKPLNEFLNPVFNLRLRVVAEQPAGLGDVSESL
ncbi:MAG: hypothetical protein QOH70_24 [Blastocatellia bacterium]|nr:hypothetical protein [Blastocatellia bacterium]